MSTPDVVYIVRQGDQNEELRTSLRSLTNLPHGNVWIVGYTPRWVTGVQSIKGNRCRSKPRNVYGNIRIACEHPDIPDEFVVMNDDFIITTPEPPDVAYRGTLADHMAMLTKRNSWWFRSLEHTREWLSQQGIDEPLSYELHRPFPIVKAQMAETLADAACFHADNPPQWRTLYGNEWDIGGTQEPDGKMYGGATDLPDTPFVSTTDGSFVTSPAVQKVRDMFPTKCRYER